MTTTLDLSEALGLDLRALSRVAWATHSLYWAHLEKAGFRYNIATARGFDRAAGELARRWSKLTKPVDKRIVKEMLRDLDVNWASVSSGRQHQLIEKAARRSKLPLGVRRQLAVDMGVAARAIQRGVLDDLAKQGLNVKASFRRYDKRIPQHISKSAVNFVTNEYGVRSARSSAIARDVVASGLRRGWGSKDIGEALSKQLGGMFARRGEWYWPVASSSYVGRGRSLSQMGGYGSAGIARYLIMSVVDERTTETCRFLDGRTFTVATSLKTFDRAEKAADPQSIKTISPWVRETPGPDGKTRMWVRSAKGGKREIGRVDKPGIGTTSPGRYSSTRDDKALANMGVSYPPYHGLCRTTTVPDV